MNTNYKKQRKYLTAFLATLFLAVFLTLFASKEAHAASQKGYATTNDLNMRKKASSNSKILKKFQRGDSMTILSENGSWYKVESSKMTGYVYAKYISFKKPAKTTGSQIASYAKKFVGNPYRWGGTSLTKGADCSGFTQSVYKHFGISIPRTSSSQRSAGKKVSSLSKAKAGDLICYYGHVAIYLGKNKIVHASSKKTGIKISNNAKYRSIASIRRLL